VQQVKFLFYLNFHFSFLPLDSPVAGGFILKVLKALEVFHLIIDAHVHLFPTREVGKEILEDIKKQSGTGYYSYGTPDEYLEDMKKAGIDKGVVVSFAPDHQLKNMNFWTVAITRPGKSKPAKYPMLLPFVSVTPTMKGKKPVEELEHKLAWGMRGLKLHPIAQKFAPDDERMRPVYRWLVDHDLPVTAHTGENIIKDEYVGFGEPNRWISVLEEFPRLRLIMAHLGNGFWEQAIEIAKKYKQVLFDTAVAISAIDSDTTLDDNEAVEMIRTIGADRILFGSDYPWINPAGDIERIRGLKISQGEIDRILGGNAAELFGLKG
jgi:predicted TIM-barrel fold metal-dependent hydrolase